MQCQLAALWLDSLPFLHLGSLKAAAEAAGAQMASAHSGGVQGTLWMRLTTSSARIVAARTGALWLGLGGATHLDACSIAGYLRW
jgi:hypothetical protein